MRNAWLGLLLGLACGEAANLQVMSPDASEAPDAVRDATDDAGVSDFGMDAEAMAPLIPLAEVGCRLPLPEDLSEGLDAVCYDLKTTESIEAPTSPPVDVHVVVLDPEAAGAPVFVLQGGPGLFGAAYVPYLSAEIREARFGQRPVIHVEQRGVGASQPALSCGPTEEVGDCRARWTDQEGRNLARFGTFEAAQDVADVARGLGLDAWLAAGGSYGSRWALEVARLAPDGLVGLYLESLVPPDISYLESFISGTDLALTRLFSACAGQPSCAARYPDLESTLEAAFAEAARQQIITRFGRLNSGLLGFAIVEAQYHQDLVPLILSGLDAVARQDAEAAGAFLEGVFQRPPQVARFLNRVILCADVAPLDDEGRRTAELDGIRPVLRGSLASISAGLDDCVPSGFPEGRSEARTPVEVDSLPMLLVMPELDGRTPDRNAQRVASSIAQAQLLALPGRVHTPGLGFQNEGRAWDACAASVVRSYLEAAERGSTDTYEAPECVGTSPLDLGAE